MINPNQALNMILNNSQAMKNPVFSNAMQLYKNGDSKGLEQIALNLCQSKGISLEQLKKQLGI